MANKSDGMKTVQASSPDWQEKCLELAQAGEDFVVEGISDDHKPFIKKLCRDRKYRQLVIEKGLLMMPGF